MQASNRSEKEARNFSRVLYFLWRTIFRQKWPFLYVTADPQKFPFRQMLLLYIRLKRKTLRLNGSYRSVSWTWTIQFGIVWSWFSLATALRDERFTVRHELFPFHSFQQNQQYLYCDSYWLLTRLVNTNLFITI